jgi:membrane dipeptidase
MEIDRRTMMAGAAALIASAPGLARKPASPSWYDRAIIIDGLGGIFDPSTPDGPIRISDRAWADMRRTGVTVVNQTLLPVGNRPDAWTELQSNMDFLDNILSANPDRLIRIDRVADIRDAKKSGRIGVIYGTQDTAMVGSALDRLAEMKKRGVRIAQLTYNLRNLSGDGSIEAGNAGLSNLGRKTIERIESEKLLLDLAHGGARTIDEAIAYAKRPLTISHTGARAITDHPRNVSDAAIRGVANKGGVVGVYFMPYLSKDSHPTGAILLDHIDHIAKVAGEDHVAIGTDGGVLPLVIDAKAKEDAKKAYEQRTAAGIAAPGEGPDVFTVVRDYNSIDKLQRLSADLMKRGWTTARIEKLLGGNLLRLYEDVWGG